MNRIHVVLSLLVYVTAVATASPAVGSEPRLVSTDPQGVEIEIDGMDYRLRSAVLDGRRFDRIDLPGAAWLPEPGRPAVPVRGVLLGVPYGVDLSVEIVSADYEEVPGVELMPVPGATFAGRGDLQIARYRYEPDPRLYSEDRFFPAQQAALVRTGLMRDQRVAAVSLRPVQYNPVRKILRIARRLRVRVRFSQSAAPRPAVRPVDEGAEGAFEPVYRGALLNAGQSRAWRGRRAGGRPALRKAQPDWYDPTAAHYKIRIREDGLYRLDAEWFEDSGIALGEGDLERLRLYLNGEEVPLEVRDGGDGRLDAGDGVFFFGRFRRAPDRDFESEYGRENVYWLALAQGPGLRMRPIDAAPRSGFPGSDRFTAAVHAEIDSLYEPLGAAADARRDHWYRQYTNSSATEGGQESSVTMPVVLPGLDREGGGTGRVRVGMHGRTHRKALDPDHRTVVRLGSGFVVAEDRWDGPSAFVAEGEVPVSELRDTLRVTLATPGSAEYPETYIDQVLFNWAEVAYPRRFEAAEGALLFELEGAGEGRTVSISGFRSPSVSAYDLKEGRILEGIRVEPDETGYRAQFEVRNDGPFLTVDSEAVRRPDRAEPDMSSDLRGERTGADYVIVTHSLFREAAERLAEHRRAGGLSAQVVDVADIYDEFAFGQVDPEAIRSFAVHAFETWTRRPGYLLLFGRASFDYRDFFDEAKNGRRNLVPGLPFQAVPRGLAFTDHLFGAVAGEDAFPDVFVGRFSMTKPRQAEAVVQKVVGYDRSPPARWRDRVLYTANAESWFMDPSDSLAAGYTEPFGLETFRIYNREDTPPEPNEDTGELIRQLNEGRLIFNYMGHGSAAMMYKFLRGTFQQEGYNYMDRIANEDRLPLVFAMSCLNGLYAEPRLVCLAEEMTARADGGAIAYISASSLSDVFTNILMNTAVYRHIFRDDARRFGQSLALAKLDLLTAFPSVVEPALGMNLMGDPAQALAVPPGPDFSISEGGLEIARQGALAAGDSTLITLRIENLGIAPQDGPEVLLVDRSLDHLGIDTLFAGTLPPFGQIDSLTVLWRLAEGGRRRLEVVLDPAGRVEETDEGNNRLEREVNVFGALTAVPTMPHESQVVSPSNVQLAVRPGAAVEGEVLGEFELSPAPAFEGAEVIRSGPVPGEAGLVSWQPPGLAAGAYYWRARLSDGRENGAWTRTQGMRVAASAPDRELLYRQRAAEAFTLGIPEDVTQLADGSVARVQQPPPMRFNREAREASVAAEGLSGTAVLCTDGTYLFAKRFYNVPPLYPGTDFLERIGTGFGGTVAGRSYGRLSDLPLRDIWVTYHGDGYIYAGDGKAKEVVRISPATGAADRIAVPDGIMEARTGLVFDGPSLATSDGAYIYNVSSGINGIPHAGWTVRVFAPAEGWRMVREFTVEPTATGFSYQYTDGVIADGRYLYLIEYGTGLTHRVRVVEAQDGRFVGEFESDQQETDIIGGQYDWINNRVWLGQLKGPMVYRYPGRVLPDFGTLTSGPIGPAGAWKGAVVTVRPGATAGARAALDILGEGPPGTFLPLPVWAGLAPGEIDLTGLDAAVRRIRLRLRLYGDGLNPSPALTEWSVRYQPASDLGLSDLRAVPSATAEAQPVTLTVDVRNRGPLNRVLGSVVAFYSGPPEDGRLLGRAAVPEATPLGGTTPVSAVWNTVSFRGSHTVTARLEDALRRPDFYGLQIASEEPVEIVPSGDRNPPEIEITALDAAGEVRPEDFLPSEPTFRIEFTDSSGIDPESVRILLDGGPSGEISEGISSPDVRDRTETFASLSFVYAPTLEDGRYDMAASAQDRLGNGPAQKALAFRVTSELRIEKVLAVPNPMSDGTEFTYILSRASAVTVRVYTLSGRLVQIMEDLPGRTGFNQVYWNGLDGDGHPLANGVYLYTVTAEDGSERARVKERLIVYR